MATTKLPDLKKEEKPQEKLGLLDLDKLLSDGDNITDEAQAKISELWLQNKINFILNLPPKKQWIMNHPMAKKKKRMDDGSIKDVPWEYLPIGRQEFLMTLIFIKWHVEIKSVQLIANSVLVTVRVHYMNRASGQMEWMDGLGAAPLQTDSGKGAIDWMYIKSAAVQMGAPAAESYAFKDAVEKLGNIFGKDVNRQEEIEYTPLLNQLTALPQKSKTDALEEKLAEPPAESISG